jgi:predicted Zn-dependent protease
VWRDVLSNAAKRLARDPAGSALFFEDRLDLTVELNAGSDRPECTVTRTRGLAARGPFGEGGLALHRSDPDPVDAEQLVAAVVRPSRRVPEFPESSSRRERPGPGVITPARSECIELLDRALSETQKLHPSAGVRARWVGFDQRVTIGLPGGVAKGDRRLGGRLRLEASTVVGDRHVAAVGEAVGVNPGEIDIGPLARGVVERLSAQTRARAVAPGERVVVLAPGIGGILVHELVGHALEGDICFARGSWLARAAEGAAVAAVGLTVIDDPRRGRAAWHVDDEGQPARPIALIRNGSVVGCLFDLESAHRSNRRTTGHGRRAGYREPVLPRMGCTFVAAGRFRPEQVVEGIADGVYVRRMEAASTDPRSGAAVFRVTDADRIRNGKLDVPLRQHILHVEARETLLGIDRIGTDLTFDPCIGSCVRDGQPLSISVGAPTIRIGMVNVRC